MTKEFKANGKTKKPKYKMGPYSNIEKQIIADNLEHKNYVEIAEMINRDPYTIKKYIEENQGVKTSLSVSNRPNIQDNDITKKEFWPILQTQFTPPELDLFKYHWNKIYEQFNNDTLPTEELQIIALIKFEILMNRNLTEQKACQDAIRQLQLQLEGETDKEVIDDIQSRMTIHMTGQGQLTKEYRDLQDKANKLFSDLKATRSDRIKQIDATKESFIAWIHKLIIEPQIRQKMGLYLEKFRLAMIQEEQRLMKYHKFEDGKVDRCIYNDVSVEYDEEKDES